MNPEDIAQQFGDESLARLYDCILQNPVHELANWILSFHTPTQIAQWILQLQEDENENANAD
mgnify:CR=1 FL=1